MHSNCGRARARLIRFGTTFCTGLCPYREQASGSDEVSRPARTSCNSAWSGAWGVSTNRPTRQFVIAELASDLVLSATLRDSTPNFDVEPVIHLRGELHRELPLDKRGPDPEGLRRDPQGPISLS